MGLSMRLPTDGNGYKVNDPLGHFKISDADGVNDPAYYGYLTADGAWYIKKSSSSDSVIRYATGVDGYTTAWTNRASLGYDLFHVIF